jgi:antitoxin ChpS
MTIPSDVLRMLDIEVGATLQLEVAAGAITARPTSAKRRYALKELLKGVTPQAMAELNAATAWSREGDPVGREIA